ncbi:hypothetical protein DSO57_1011907 [Entomophthora muscae]|uniref:Uncharacterized protein n=1 Tax=Entomophthora muscae TaxID=34485 RepID=A0ACC2SJ07_9FUNG|nr:hypothetical protein DSO57_1011907 [Entomophthora muscae]
MENDSGILELRDLNPKGKAGEAGTPTEYSLYDSEDDLDELEDLDLEATSKWWPSFCKHLILLLVVASISMIAISCLVHFQEVDFRQVLVQSLPRNSGWDKNLSFLLLTWIALVFCFGILLSFLLSAIPAFVLSFNRLIVPGKIETTKEYIESFQELRSIFLYSITITFGFILYCILLRYSATVDLEQTGVTVDIFRALLWFLIISYFVAAEKFLIQLISVRFHRTAYKQRIEEAKVATHILDNLNTAVSKSGLSYSKIVKIEQARAAKTRGFTDRGGTNSDSEYGDYETQLSFMQPSNSNTFRSSKANSQRGINMSLNSDPLKLTEEDPSSLLAARKLSRKIFFALKKDKRQLGPEDFIPWFKTREEADQAFNFFDKDGNGDVSRREMRDAILRAYKERKDLVKALRDMSQVIGKLDKFLCIMALLLAISICGIFFGKNTREILIAINAFFFGCKFMITESITQFLQSIVFLFAMHPYDVGDRVYIEKFTYFVKKVGLLGTEFRCTNGQITYIPHHILITKIIYNARRSEKQVDTIDFLISYDTPKEKIVMLKEHIDNYVKEVESREFTLNPPLVIDSLEDSNKMKMFILLEHKFNWQDNTKRNIRKTRFLMKLRDICTELSLSYDLPIQKVIHMDSSAS